MVKNNIVVINIETNSLVPFMVDEHGEVVILSSGVDNNSDNCIVTTWDEYTNKKLSIRRND